MNIPFLITGFMLGITGSLHCIGMCGPLALSLPLHALPLAKKIIAILLYNLGRITSYSLLGLITGLLGRQFFIGGYQQFLSIVLGSMILVFLLISFKRQPARCGSLIYKKIQGAIIHYLKNPSLANTFAIGIGNGLLPCGMVYLGMMTAASSGNIVTSTAFMTCFGLGTTPLLTMVSLAGLHLHPSAKNILRNVSPYITAFIGILLILRGLNLNIPYVSPLLASPNEKVIIPCH